MRPNEAYRAGRPGAALPRVYLVEKLEQQTKDWPRHSLFRAMAALLTKDQLDDLIRSTEAPK